jgi:hypothetical protein
VWKRGSSGRRDSGDAAGTRSGRDRSRQVEEIARPDTQACEGRRGLPFQCILQAKAHKVGCLVVTVGSAHWNTRLGRQQAEYTLHLPFC